MPMMLGGTIQSASVFIFVGVLGWLWGGYFRKNQDEYSRAAKLQWGRLISQAECILGFYLIRLFLSSFNGAA
jgi:hypothetical protein